MRLPGHAYHFLIKIGLYLTETEQKQMIGMFFETWCIVLYLPSNMSHTNLYFPSAELYRPGPDFKKKS